MSGSGSRYNAAMSIPYGPILIVEDVPNVLELLEVTLKFKGYPVVTAMNGQEALDVIQREHPAMIISDILMPRMDGFTLAHNLRKDPRSSQIPLIFLSATYLNSDDKAFAMSLGAARFLEKPIDTEEFLLTIAEVLTMDYDQHVQPMDEEEFYTRYRERLESKLKHKNTQIARTERLLQTLPDDQKPAFQTLLAQVISDRDEIQSELDELHKILSQIKDETQAIY